MRGLKDKVAIVTGAAGRIGRAVVQRFVEEGACVVAADINIAGAEALAASLGDRVFAVAHQCADEASNKALMESAMKRFGAINILHNNAAYVGVGDLGEDTDAMRTPIALWDTTMEVNLKSYFLACRFALPYMIDGGGGSIINTSSGSAMRGDSVRIAYGASKAGVSAFTKYVATQHGKQGIRCNAIAPGMIADEALRQAMPKLYELSVRHALTPRGGEPDDIAGLVAFLASDDSAFITGQMICVDGGSLAHVPQMIDAAALADDYS